MQNLEVLVRALDYMENHLEENIRTEDIAQAAFCSKSLLEKMFRSINRISVHDYLVRRRMTVAAKLLSSTQISVIDVALRFGYSTPESFCRAFEQNWNCAPSVFRKAEMKSALFPKIDLPDADEKGEIDMRRKFDIGELYDLLKSRKDCYFVICDIVGLGPINNISQKAGDIAIIESLTRLEKSGGDEDVAFRIGADEFVMLTNSTDKSYAEAIAEKVRAENGKLLDYKEKDVPLNLHVGVTKLETVEPLKYVDLFAKLNNSISKIKTAVE